MKKLSLFPSIVKGTLLIVLLAVGGMLKAQTITINNNAACSMKVFIIGVDNCSPCYPQDAVVVPPTSSVQVTPTGNGCTIDNIVGVKVKAICYTGSVTVADDGCVSCTAPYPNSDSFSIPSGAGCCYPIGATILVNADCSGSDLLVTIDD